MTQTWLLQSPCECFPHVDWWNDFDALLALGESTLGERFSGQPLCFEVDLVSSEEENMTACFVALSLRAGAGEKSSFFFSGELKLL